VDPGPQGSRVGPWRPVADGVREFQQGRGCPPSAPGELRRRVAEAKEDPPGGLGFREPLYRVGGGVFLHVPVGVRVRNRPPVRIP
jgi:hypothetical protein